MRHVRLFAALLAASFVGSAVARADIDFTYGGTISSDIRYRLNGEEVVSPYPSQYRLLKYGFSRNENLINGHIGMSIANKVKAVGDVDLYLYGYSDVNDIDGLTLREKVDPYRIEVNAAYLDVYRLLPGLDVRIGRQIVSWGAADKFNPTNNVNTLDFSDPLLFGKALANNMIRLDWNPKGDWIITGVVVPIFRPSQLPRTAPLALLNPDRPLSIQDDAVRRSVSLLESIYRPQQVNVYTMVPEASIKNVQVALKVSGRILDQDVSLSYYRGRFGFPVPATTIFSPGGIADVGVVWPRMDVLGADISGTIEKLAGMGYWIEAGVFFPQRVSFALYNDMGGHFEERFTVKDGVAAANPVNVDAKGHYLSDPVGARPLINDSTPFLKLTMGGDLSLGKHVYINVQYVHGFFDEFGAGYAWHLGAHPSDDPRKDQRIGDYMVAGTDLKFFSDKLLFRFFGILKLPSIDVENHWKLEKWTPSGVLFPQIAYQVWDGTELSVGGFVFLGDSSSKFGDPAVGASEVFLKAKFSY